MSVGVAVTPPPYPVIFREQGLADGTGWSVTTHATTHSATVSGDVNNIGFSIPNGSYSYSITPIPGYSAQYSGSYTVAGGPVFIRVIFHAGALPPHTAIYAETNSTSIRTFALPQIQEFTVGAGSGTLPVNFVTLYLNLVLPSKPGGSMMPAAAGGTVVFSLGLLKFGSGVLTNTTVPVTYTGWYNVSFPSVNLALGTDYYLNVYGTSGNVQWGYTSAPTVMVNTLTEFFYYGTKLLSDTSTPDLYSVGFSGVATPALAFSPSNGVVGSAVTLTGSGFTVGDTVTPLFGGTSETCNEGIVVVGSAGSFTCTINVPDVPNGPYGIGASTSGDGTVTAAQTFTVRGAPSEVTIYAQTNSTSIFMYALPQAQEFTVGAGSGVVPVSFVTLYLGGSGTVAFSLGSTVFGTDVLGATAVVVTHTGWYNVSFTPVNLALGTDYFLNVYQGGSVTWGYTAAPTVKVNTLTEYYYVGTTLIADTSTPNLFSVGYATGSPELPMPVPEGGGGTGAELGPGSRDHGWEEPVPENARAKRDVSLGCALGPGHGVNGPASRDVSPWPVTPARTASSSAL